MKDLILKLKMFFTKLLPCFSLIIPKRKNLWIFGSWQGKLYADNTKALFEYINKNHSNIDAVWITREGNIVKKLKNQGYKCYTRYSLKGIWATLRAEIAFETEGIQDISYFLNSKKTKVVQLWHGMGAKALQWKSKNGEKTFEDEKRRREVSSYYWISTSELYTKVNSELQGVPRERFVITGYPRNDNIFHAPYNEFMENLKKKYINHHFVIYMPTHRNFGADGNKLINLDELKKVDLALKDKNIIMVYKPHMHELKNFIPYENTFSNIILAKDQEIWGDVYNYLHYFDLLISDYSSVMTDFMCTGKPIVIFAYDIDEYINGDAGLNDFFWEFPGGPMCYTWANVVETTYNLLVNDSWKEEREMCRKQYHNYNDGCNCERVYDMVKNIVLKDKIS
ncbi:MAG: CDP-glycerol glycerophosphotransferase family protein [Clostridia bacterium]|nr:CDP-glycerol glycerophosphotransferase family protein [Clostridia bacterium]